MQYETITQHQESKPVQYRRTLRDRRNSSFSFHFYNIIFPGRRKSFRREIDRNKKFYYS